MIILTLFHVPPMVSDSSQILPVHWHLFASKDIFVPYLGSTQFLPLILLLIISFPQVHSVACTIPWKFPELVILFQGATLSLCSFPCLVNSLSLLFFCLWWKPSWGNILISCWHWFFSYIDIASSSMMRNFCFGHSDDYSYDVGLFFI